MPVAMNRTGLDAAFDALLQAMSDQDLPRTMACLSTTHEPAILGSEAGESARGTDQVASFLRHLYEHRAPFQFAFPERRWTVHGTVAWMTADGRVDDLPYRLTALFVREDDSWKLALWSGAEPVPSRTS